MAPRRVAEKLFDDGQHGLVVDQVHVGLAPEPSPRVGVAVPVHGHVLVAPADVEAVLLVGAGRGQRLIPLKDMLVVDLIELVQLLLIEHVGHDDIALSCERVAHRVIHLLISLRIASIPSNEIDFCR